LAAQDEVIVLGELHNGKAKLMTFIFDGGFYTYWESGTCCTENKKKCVRRKRTCSQWSVSIRRL